MGKKLKSLEDYNKERCRKNRNEPRLNGIECPNCKSELYDSNPMIVLTSCPPKKAIHCSECGYKGNRIA